MINISVFSVKNISIETTEYNIESQESMIKFLKELLDKIYYGGERVCLEKADINTEKGLVNYTEVERWSGRLV